MHETALVKDLMLRAETEAPGESITLLRFRVGALSGVAPAFLSDFVQREALARWGSSPRVEVEESQDPTELGAGGVILVTVGTEV